MGDLSFSELCRRRRDDDPVKKVMDTTRAIRPGRMLHVTIPCRQSHRGETIAITGKDADAVGQGCHLSGRDKKSFMAVRHDLGNGSRCRGDDWQSKGHGFEIDDAKSLIKGRNGQAVMIFQQSCQGFVIDRSLKHHTSLKACALNQAFNICSIAAVSRKTTRDSQLPMLVHEAAKSADQDMEALARDDVPDEKELQGSRFKAAIQDLACGNVGGDMVPSGISHNARVFFAEKMQNDGAGCFAVENAAIYGPEILLFHPVIKDILPSRTSL